MATERETRIRAALSRREGARRDRRDRLTTYGLAATTVIFCGARYVGLRSLERACLALLGAFALYAVGVALASMGAYSQSIMELPEPDSDEEGLDHDHFHAGSIKND